MTKEDVVNVKPVSGVFLFGYEESVRNQKLNDVIGELQTQINEVRTKATRFNEAAKRMNRPQEKQQAKGAIENLVKQAEELKVQ